MNISLNDDNTIGSVDVPGYPIPFAANLLKASFVVKRINEDIKEYEGAISVLKKT